MRENTSVHRLLRRVLSLCLAVVLAVSLCVPALAAQKNYSANDYVQRLKDSVRGSATVDLDAGKDPNEVVRAMVVTDVPAAVEQTGTVSYTAAVQSAEARTLRSQESVIRQVRRITGQLRYQPVRLSGQRLFHGHDPGPDEAGGCPGRRGIRQ